MSIFEIFIIEKEIAQIFNDQYVDIVEKTTGDPPVSVQNDGLDVEHITVTIKAINEHNHSLEPFHIPQPKLSDIQNILKNIDTKKSAGPGMIFPLLVKMCSGVIDQQLVDVTGQIIASSIFPDSSKIAHVTPVYKKKGRTDKANYRPVSGTGTLAKILERYIQDKLCDHIDKCLSTIISAYRKKYSTNNVLISMIEKWKKQMDNKMFVGAVLMDLSKDFDCVPHDLLIAKLHAYKFDMDALILFYSYLKNRQQCVKINNVFSSFMVLVSGVPQGSILRTYFI